MRVHEEFAEVFRGKDIAITWEYEDYDDNLSCNGGSYYQPVITCTSGDEVFEIEDSSCGDFGGRFFASLKRNGQTVAVCIWGRMEEESGNLYTTFDISRESDRFWLDFAADVLEYYPYYWGERKSA